MFKTPLDLRAHTPGEWVVLNPLVWNDIVVPAGFITDLASIPRIFRNIEDQNGLSRRPAVLHDYLYCLQPFEKLLVDRLFRTALIVEGMNRFSAEVYYRAVRLGGGRYWNERGGRGLQDWDFTSV